MTTPTAQTMPLQAESEQSVRDRRAAIALLAKAARKSASPSDKLAYRMDMLLIDHPEWCSTDADYPGWTPGAKAVTR